MIPANSAQTNIITFIDIFSLSTSLQITISLSFPSSTNSGHSSSIVKMNKSRVPISWASRLILNKFRAPVPFTSQFLVSHSHSRDFSIDHEESKQAIYDKDSLDGAFKWMAKLDKSVEKKQFPVYTTGGQLAKYTTTPACGNYNGVVGLAKAKGLAVPITFQKAYETSFQTRMIHNLADKVKQLEIPNAKVAGNWESRSSYSNKAEETTNQPQLNSTPPTLNRVSATYLTITLASSYLLYVNLGLACFSLETFYQLGYSSKLTLISIEMAVLAMTYHTISGFNNIVADYTSRRLER